MKLIDLTGKRFGKLVVITRAEDFISKSGNHRTMWLCKCDCGNETVVESSNIRSGHTQSCGCLQKEKTSKMRKKYNRYELFDKYGIGYTFNTNKMFYFDLEDYDKIKDYCWWELKIKKENENGYAVATIKDKKIMMHRFIMNTPKGMSTDHINHNRLDNRKKNLRICTISQNGMNTPLRADNKSGHKGVYWDKANRKWIARITANNTNIHLGRFIDIKDAIKAREEAEIKYFGEYRNK